MSPRPPTPRRSRVPRVLVLLAAAVGGVAALALFVWLVAAMVTMVLLGAPVDAPIPGGLPHWIAVPGAALVLAFATVAMAPRIR